MDFLFTLDWSALLKIVLLDIVLGGDNAVVIALACAAVPLEQRRKAILGGTAAAIVLRIIFLAIAAFLITVPFIKVVAGLLLFKIGYGLLTNEDDEGHSVTASDKVWGAIKEIAVADIIMSIDNVFAVTGASQSAGAHSELYAIGGILLSIPIIVFGATLLGSLIDRFPIIVWFGGGLLGWVAAEMIVTDVKTAQYFTSVHHFIPPAIGAALVLSAAVIKRSHYREKAVTTA